MGQGSWNSLIKVNALEPCAYSPGPNPEWVALLPGSPEILELRLVHWAVELTGMDTLHYLSACLWARDLWWVWKSGDVGAWASFCPVASCGMLWRGAGTLLLSTSGGVPGGMYNDNLGTTKTQVVVVSPELPFLATLCPLLPLWGWKRKDLGREEQNIPLDFTISIVHSYSSCFFSQWLNQSIQTFFFSYCSS